MSIFKKLNYYIFRYGSDVIPTNPTLLFFTALNSVAVVETVTLV